MKKLILFFMSLVLIVIIVFYSPSELLAKNTSAYSKNSNIINGDMQLSEVSSSEFKISDEIQSDGHYYWRVTSKSIVGYPYGKWRKGPSGKGPATISLTNSKGYNFNVTNTISGSYTSVGAIAGSLGIAIGKSKTYSASYSVKVPKKKKYQIIYRPQFKRYKIVQTQFYKIDGNSVKTKSKKYLM